MTWDATSAVTKWVTGAAPNFGLYLKRHTEPSAAGGPAPPGMRFTGELSLTPRLVVTFVGDAVALAQPAVVHGNGAELSWSRYASPTGNPFQRYEVHRSPTANFTPSAATPMARPAWCSRTAVRLTFTRTTRTSTAPTTAPPGRCASARRPTASSARSSTSTCRRYRPAPRSPVPS